MWWHAPRSRDGSMRIVSAHDLRTGAAFVLPATARCVPVTAELHALEDEHGLEGATIGSTVDPRAVRRLGSLPPGSIVYAETRGRDTVRWTKLRVVAVSRPTLP